MPVVRRAASRTLGPLLLALSACGGSGPPPPDPDPRGFEPAVAEAIRGAREAVLARPRSAEAWGRLGEVFDAHDFLPEAVSCYVEAERLDPSDFRWPYFAAICSEDRGPGPVAEALRRAHGLRPQDVPTNVRLGRALLDLGEREEAKARFETALRGDPSSTHALLGLAAIALEAGDPAGSRSLLERAAEIRPDHAEVRALLARVYRSEGRATEASEASARAGSVTRKTPIPDPHRAEVLERGASAGHRAQQGHAALRAGRLDVAVERFRASLASKPDSAEVRLALAHTLLALRRPEECLEALRPALSREPPIPEVLNTYAWLRATLPEAGLRDGAEAVALAERACRASEEPPYWHLGTLGAAYAEAGRFADAVAATDRAIASAQRAGDAPFVEGARRRRDLFAQGIPFREER